MKQLKEDLVASALGLVLGLFLTAVGIGIMNLLAYLEGKTH